MKFAFAMQAGYSALFTKNADPLLSLNCSMAYAQWVVGWVKYSEGIVNRFGLGDGTLLYR